MSRRYLALCSITYALIAGCGPDQMSARPERTAGADSVLRHIVIFKFGASAPPAQVAEITRRFGLLKDSIPGILAYEHGVNNSPEGLNKGLDHVYQITFESAAARDAYLPHAAHQRFVGLLDGALEDVMVVDYWGVSEVR